MREVKPKIKPTVQVNFIEDCIYFRVCGTAKQVQDSDGALKKLLSYMNGNNTIAQLADKLLPEYPEATADEVKKIIEVLDQHLLVEDNNQVRDASLSVYDVTRWQRNINFFGSFCNIEANKYDLQQKIKQTKVCLLGLGGLGSHILFDLAAMGVQHIQTVEFDKVELSNLNRQILYTEEDIGQSKAAIAKQRILAF